MNDLYNRYPGHMGGGCGGYENDKRCFCIPRGERGHDGRDGKDGRDGRDCDICDLVEKLRDSCHKHRGF